MTIWQSGMRLTPARLNPVWEEYAPTWACSTTPPALGNGTLIGRYVQLGKVVHFQIQFTAGSTTTFGAGSFSFSLPAISANAGINAQAIARVTDASPNMTYTAYGQIAPDDDEIRFITDGSGSISATTPFTWASGDSVRISGTYEAA